MAASYVQGGLQTLLEVLFRNATGPTSFQVGLITNASLAANATIGDVTELAGDTYARQTINRDATAAGFSSSSVGSNAWNVVAPAVTFTNSSGNAWAAANTAILVARVSGNDVLIGHLPLSTARTLQPLDSLTVTFTSLKLTEG